MKRIKRSRRLRKRISTDESEVREIKVNPYCQRNLSKIKQPLIKVESATNLGFPLSPNIVANITSPCHSHLHVDCTSGSQTLLVARREAFMFDDKGNVKSVHQSKTDLFCGCIMELSESSRLICLGGKDSNLSIIGSSGGRSLSLKGHTGGLFHLRPCPQFPSLLLAVGSKGTMWIWDVASRRKLAVLRGHTGSIKPQQATHTDSWMPGDPSAEVVGPGYSRAFLEETERGSFPLQDAVWLNTAKHPAPGLPLPLRDTEGCAVIVSGGEDVDLITWVIPWCSLAAGGLRGSPLEVRPYERLFGDDIQPSGATTVTVQGVAREGKYGYIDCGGPVRMVRDCCSLTALGHGSFVYRSSYYGCSVARLIASPSSTGSSVLKPALRSSFPSDLHSTSMRKHFTSNPLETLKEAPRISIGTQARLLHVPDPFGYTTEKDDRPKTLTDIDALPDTTMDITASTVDGIGSTVYVPNAVGQLLVFKVPEIDEESINTKHYCFWDKADGKDIPLIQPSALLELPHEARTRIRHVSVRTEAGETRVAAGCDGLGLAVWTSDEEGLF